MSCISCFKSFKNLLCILPLVIFFTSCSNDHSDDNASYGYSVLNQSLMDGNKLIMAETEKTLQLLQERGMDENTAAKANIWYPRALAITERTKKIITFIDEFLIRFSKAKDEDTEIVKSTWETKTGSDLLQQRLGEYRRDVLLTDSVIHKAFEGKLIIPSTEKLFANATAIKSQTLLRSLQQSILVFENEIVNFCFNKTNVVFDVFINGSSIMGQCNTVVRQGEKVEIEARLLHLSNKIKPEMIIDGKEVPVRDDGLVKDYSFKAGTRGEHTVPVYIKYYDDETGEPDVIATHFAYTVR